MLRELNSNEMEQASGGALNLVIGAGVGFGFYAATQWINGEDITLGGALASAALGAATSGVGAFVHSGRVASAAGQTIRTASNAAEAAEIGGLAFTAGAIGGFGVGATGGMAAGVAGNLGYGGSTAAGGSSSGSGGDRYRDNSDYEPCGEGTEQTCST